AHALRESRREVEGRRAPHEVAEERVQLVAETCILARLDPGGGELVERRDQHLGNEPASVRSEALRDGAGGRLRAHAATWGSCDPERAASTNAAIAAWSLTPGSTSTPLA